MASELILRDDLPPVPALITKAGGNARFAYDEFL